MKFKQITEMLIEFGFDKESAEKIANKCNNLDLTAYKGNRIEDLKKYSVEVRVKE